MKLLCSVEKWVISSTWCHDHKYEDAATALSNNMQKQVSNEILQTLQKNMQQFSNNHNLRGGSYFGLHCWLPLSFSKRKMYCTVKYMFFRHSMLHGILLTHHWTCGNKMCMLLIKTVLYLDGDFTTRFGDEFWERFDGIVGVLTHMNLQSWNNNNSLIFHI